MRSVRKEIERLHGIKAVLLEQDHKVPGKGRRIAGDRKNAGGGGFEKCL